MIFTKDAAQFVASPTADPGVMSSIPAQSHTFMEIDHELFSMVSLLLRLIQEKVYVRTLQGKVLVNSLVKLAQEKVWLGVLTFST